MYTYHMHSIVITLPACNLNIGLALLVKGINVIKPNTYRYFAGVHYDLNTYRCFAGMHYD